MKRFLTIAIACVLLAPRRLRRGLGVRHARLRRRARSRRPRARRRRRRRCRPRPRRPTRRRPRRRRSGSRAGRDHDEQQRLAPDRDRGAGRRRLHRARRALGRDRPRPVGRRRHAGPRLRLRARPGRAAVRRDADHRRGDLRGRGDAGRGRHRLHGPDREQGAARATEGDQLRRAVRLVPALHPHRDEQHLLLDHPGDQRGLVREQDPARAHARRARPSPRRMGITSSPVAAAMATLLPLVEIYHYNLVDVLLITIPASIVGIFVMSLVMSRHGKDLEDDAEYQRRVEAGEVQPPAAAERHRVAALREAQRRDLPRRRARDLHLRPLRGDPADGRGRGRRASSRSR